MVLLKTLSSLWSNATSQLRPVMIFMRLKFDETPTRVRLVEPCFDSLTPTACLEEMPGATSSSLHTKVMQIEFAMGVLSFDTQNDQYTWIFGELPTALRAVQSTNGLTTFKCLKDVINSVPGYVDFAWEQDFKLHVRHCCSDSYSANFLAERLLKQDMPSWISADTVCDVHRLYTATKTAMSTVDYDISGLLNLSLALSGAGTVSTLRKILARIFGRRLTIIYEHAPTETMGSPAQMYQQELFDTFLPTIGVDSARRTLNEKRRFVLSYYLNGRLGPGQKVIEHWCPFGCCHTPSQTLMNFSKWVCWALIPCSLHRFPRSRWTNYDRSIDWTGLLAGCGLLEELFVEFCGKSVASTAAPTHAAADVPTENPVPIHDDDGDWEAAFKADFPQADIKTSGQQDSERHQAPPTCQHPSISTSH